VQTLEGARVCITNFFLFLLDALLESKEIKKELDLKAQEIQNFA